MCWGSECSVVPVQVQTVSCPGAIGTDGFVSCHKNGGFLLILGTECLLFWMLTCTGI